MSKVEIISIIGNLHFRIKEEGFKYLRECKFQTGQIENMRNRHEMTLRK
jgi:hypothetical protein